VLDVCVAAEDEESEAPEPTEDPTDAVDNTDDDAGVDDTDDGTTLPVTGGGAALGGMLLLGTAGLLVTRMRRRA
jgi:hypothetical protein